MSEIPYREPLPQEDKTKVRWDRLKTVNLNEYVGKLGSGPINKKTIEELKKNLKMGRNLQELILNEGNIYENEDRFYWLPKVISRHLVELRTLDLTTFLINSADLAHLSLCYALRTVKLTTEFKFNGKWFAEFCNNNPSMIRMTLTADGLDKECLDALPRSLKHLELAEVNVINSDALISSIEKMNLLSISFISVSNLGSNFLHRLAEAAPGLEELKLTNTSQLNLEAIGKFRALRSLLININNENKDELFLLDLALHCSKLEELEFYKVNQIPKHWFSFLANLHKLKVLKLRNVITISEGNFAYLKSIESLRILEIHGCDDFTDEVAIDLLKGCGNLCLLEITNCSNVQDVIENAVEVIKELKRDSVLTLKLEDVNIDLEEALKHKHPLLKVSVNGVELLNEMQEKNNEKEEEEGTEDVQPKKKGDTVEGIALLNEIAEQDIKDKEEETVVGVELSNEIEEKTIEKKEENAVVGVDLLNEIEENRRQFKKSEDDAIVE